ncbi:MAG: hypothetical protein QN152_01925 [Armatimonadota bacterium]|nr:hypothetical protein [Armatimonadota bacterium]MDR7538279.1 hypothetical protein [Armatimonadota bacterium]
MARTLLVPGPGTWSKLTQAPQVASETFTPAAIRSTSNPSRASSSSAVRLLGWTKKTSECTRRPQTMRATACRSV